MQLVLCLCQEGSFCFAMLLHKPRLYVPIYRYVRGVDMVSRVEQDGPSWSGLDHQRLRLYTGRVCEWVLHLL